MTGAADVVTPLFVDADLEMLADGLVSSAVYMQCTNVNVIPRLHDRANIEQTLKHQAGLLEPRPLAQMQALT